MPDNRHAGGALEEVSLGGSLIGAFTEADIATARLRMAPGDLLVLYTDGVVEARRRDRGMFGEEAFRAVVAASGATAGGALGAGGGSSRASSRGRHVGGRPRRARLQRPRRLTAAAAPGAHRATSSSVVVT